MGEAIIISLIVLAWYCVKAYRINPAKPDWNKAFVITLFWPLSLLMKRYR
ncbi:hypothetical protein LZD49_03140 [Dyadobacter sp. CY261]|nr:hypothetical protein [Dyadobacter sp. CY261]MCF0069449.1 hypothetical protein [Dyadobacter sp. CY261]